MAEQFQFFMDKANLDFAQGLEQRVYDVLKENNMTIAVAESLTGGLLAHTLTRIPGSSKFFLGGAVCYSPRAKIIQTGIDPKIIAEHGIVSEQTSAGLARGIKQRLFTNLGIGITGVAGPEVHGGKPVGTVFIALADGEREIVKEFVFDGEREDIQRKTVQAALGVIWMYLKDKEV